MESEQLRYLLAPLDGVDLQSLGEIADRLRLSRNRKDKAVGLFLRRVITVRTRGLPGREAAPLDPRRFNWASGLHSLRASRLC
jgi:hypothetical protein